MTLIASLTKLGSVQNNSISKSQINSLSGATSSQSSNSVASHNPDVHVLIVGRYPWYSTLCFMPMSISKPCIL
ncbi:hypothetical protein PPL_08578 [Heterostelium album PN500]|uniref:Uncharacterized protein n=1 Tax=Heterostelium pallidum (strain ATCC 26659 / Pp 5 / PN500) TaxID=670386 RepID=D3BJ53_HETP5|nr:hypothetical protein PPL_08578 [Heterostelium album PN500]EFA77933.1 hypothetical protein PPL_08578 [Heterostelium album PN500]|eukprot:XP_020430061.1 hypothetical protein PPL_08578 [Heterostelium album PN500]